MAAIWDGIKNIPHETLEEIKEGGGDIKNAGGDVLHAATSFGKNTVDGIDDALHGGFNFVKSLGQGFLDGVKGVWNAIKSFGSGLWDALRDMWNWLGDNLLYILMIIGGVGVGALVLYYTSKSVFSGSNAQQQAQQVASVSTGGLSSLVKG